MTDTYEPPLTPVRVEQELMKLLKSNLDAYRDLRDAEAKYEGANAAYQIAYAKARLATFAAEESKGWSVARRDDWATLQTQTERNELAAATALVKAARARASAVKVQADLIRSIGTSVRVSMGFES